MAYLAFIIIWQPSSAASGTTEYTYDALGNLTSQTSPTGAKTGYTYDVLERLTSVEDADENVTSYAYDAVGNLTDVIDANGGRTTYAYDAIGNTTSITSPQGASERLEYDLQGRLSALTAPDGETTSYDYDAIGDLVTKTYSEDASARVDYTYDALGQKASRQDSAGKASFAYDEAGRILTETTGQGDVISYAYDDAGQVSSITYPDGTEVGYGYDAAGNLTTVDAPEGTYTYTFDELNRPTSLTRPNGTRTTFAYDDLGHTTSIVATDDAKHLLSAYTYTYDNDGHITSEISDVVSENNENMHTERALTYTKTGFLETLSESGSAGPYTERYTYDKVGNKTSLERTGEGADSITYEYDADNRLVKSTSSVHGVCEYAYDAAGNLISKRGAGCDTSYAYGVEGRLVAVREGGRLLMAAAYDGDGDRVSSASLFHEDVQREAEQTGEGLASLPATSYLNIASDEHIAHAWSAFVYGATTLGAALSSSLNPTCMHTFTDAALRLLMSSLPDDAKARTSLMSFSFLSAYERDRIASSIGSLPSVSTFESEQFDVISYANSHIGNISQVLSSVSTHTGTTNETYGITRLARCGEGRGISYYLNDGRGSVVQTTNERGRVTSWKRYSSTGSVEASSPLGELSSYGWNAEEQNPQTGLTYLRFRYLDTDTGVFGVTDTYLGNVFNPLSLNRYLYCLSDPVNYVDPTGHAARTLAIFNEIRRAKTILPQYRSKSQPGMSPNASSSTQLRVTTHLVAPGKPEKAKYSNLNYTMNTWYAMQAERAGDAEAAARYYQLANQYHQWYLQHYCGAEKKPMGELPSQMHDWASTYWYVPAVSSIVDMCAYTAEGNAPMTVLYSAMSLVEVLTLGTSAEMLAPIKGATKAPVGIEELIKGITRLPGAASSALKGVMKLPSLAANALRESIADGAKAIERLASSVTGRQLASEGADAGASVTGGYTKYEAKATGGSSGAGTTTDEVVSSGSAGAAKAESEAVRALEAARIADTVEGNRLHHIFDDPKHKMDSFLAKYGNDQEKAYFAIQDAAYKYGIKERTPIAKYFTRITVDGEDVDATWRIVNGKFMLVDASRRDILP